MSGSGWPPQGSTLPGIPAIACGPVSRRARLGQASRPSRSGSRPGTHPTPCSRATSGMGNSSSETPLGFFSSRWNGCRPAVIQAEVCAGVPVRQGQPIGRRTRTSPTGGKRAFNLAVRTASRRPKQASTEAPTERRGRRLQGHCSREFAGHAEFKRSSCDLNHFEDRRLRASVISLNGRLA